MAGTVHGELYTVWVKHSAMEGYHPNPVDSLDEALEIMMAMNVPRDRVVITGPELVVTLAFKEPK